MRNLKNKIKRSKLRSCSNLIMDVTENGVHKNKTEEEYIYPQDPIILAELEDFKDMKLGFMTHLGLYNQMGIIESWALSDEKERGSWSQWGIDWTDIETFKQQYFDMNKSFNPMRFDPVRWKNFIVRNGFKYAVLPTKHHDGFCLWDTKYTNYKSTDVQCPFSEHKYSDIFGTLVNELNKEEIKIGAYFSKADWHHESYWSEEYKKSGNTQKHPGYDPVEKPEMWEDFCQFTKNQMMEIVENYDNIDIMWLDGGWLSKEFGEDLKIEETMHLLREINPNIIVVDRMCGGEAENYVTPEQKIPPTYMSVPWESCITISGGFNYSYEERYKSAEKVAKIFVEILCKGGNLSLNLSPQPDGRFANEAIHQIERFGQWVNHNAHAIYGTRPIAPYWNQTCGIVQAKDGKKYLFVLWDEQDLITPKYVYFNIDYQITKAKYEGKDAEVKYMGNRYRITIPESEVDTELPLSLVFEIE